MQEGIRVASNKSERPVAARDRVGYFVDGRGPCTPNVSENKTSPEDQSLPRHVSNRKKKLPRTQPEKNEEIVSQRL